MCWGWFEGFALYEIRACVTICHDGVVSFQKRARVLRTFPDRCIVGSGVGAYRSGNSTMIKKVETAQAKASSPQEQCASISEHPVEASAATTYSTIQHAPSEAQHG
jgi:hypothetical protein